MSGLQFYHKEFEAAVRRATGVNDRPLTAADVRQAEILDCSEFDFDERDIATLGAFKDLRVLCIDVPFADLSFLGTLTRLEELDIVCREVDCAAFAGLSQLRELCISGGTVSNMVIRNFEALRELKHLCGVALHEFGTVDLRALGGMPQLTSFFCGYADRVENAWAIGKLTHLEELTLIDLTLPDLSFLETLPASTSVELCGIRVDTADERAWRRFSRCDIEEITVGGKRVV